MGVPQHAVLAVEAALYANLVDRFDAGVLPDVHSYAELYDIVRSSLDSAHMEGRLRRRSSPIPNGS